MSGTNRNDGSELGGWEHCAQSIHDILTTRIGSRVMRREYGSDVPNLIDRPGTNDIVLEITMATGTALDAWEPRYKFRGLGIIGVDGQLTAGNFEISIVGDYYPRGHLGDYSVMENDRSLTIPLAREIAFS